jgi:flagellar hook assembly protein FlgD
VRDLEGYALPPALPVQLSAGARIVEGENAGSVPIYLNGEEISVWDGRDDSGRTVPPGFYHAVAFVPSSDGSIRTYTANIRLTAASDPNKAVLTAWPNVLRGDGVLHVRLGQAGGGACNVKIYDLAGELVRVLSLKDGEAVWDAKTSAGARVSPGIYLLVAEPAPSGAGRSDRPKARIVVLP